MDIQAHLALRFDALQKSMDKTADAVRNAQEFQLERARAIKAIRLPVVQAAGANPFTMGGDVGELIVGPEQGFVWSIRHLVIEGLTTGATPDVVNIRRSSAQGQVIWQLNGNQFAQTWGRGEIILFGGETLFYQSSGTFVATGTIKAYGLAEQVPGEKIGMFY